MEEVIKKLNKGLEDPEYREGWVANIAMAYKDCERWYQEEHNKTYLNSEDKHIIANNAANYFLNQLAK